MQKRTASRYNLEEKKQSEERNKKTTSNRDSPGMENFLEGINEGKCTQKIFFNLGIRARQRLRSFALEMNDLLLLLLLLWPMISGDGWGLSFPHICLTIGGKNINQEN